MAFYLLAGILALLLLWWLARWLSTVSPSDLAQAVRTFVAVFSALASTGLIWMGRFGLALVTLAATAMAVRSLMRARRGADPLEEEPQGSAAGTSRIRTAMLEMELDRQSGDLDGRVLAGPFKGRRLSSLGPGELLALYRELAGADPQGQQLLEAYLDRRDPAWRSWEGAADGAQGESGPVGAMPMDERTAYAILGLEPGASEEEIKAAYRRLMAKLHPDHGGTSFLATQLNRARELLLKRRAGDRR